jgi:beta-lactamase regulating signal transducer with metallopeptidase domain
MSFALSVIFKTTILLCFASLMTLGLRRVSASVRHTVWAFALFAAVLLPLASVLLPPVELPLLPEAHGELAILSNPGFRISDLWRVPDPQVRNTQTAIRNSLVPPPEPARPWYWQQWILGIWGTGVAVVLIRLLLGSLSVRRLGKDALRVDARHWLDVLETLKSRLGISGPICLKIGKQSIPPMTWGILRHVVLLPATAADWTTERQHLVLAHELAHVKRHDGVIQILVQAVCSLYWFNPLAWYAARQLRVARECACDDQVLRLGTGADDYADHLLQVARAVSPDRGLSMATVAMAHRSQLETRLLSILDTRTKRYPTSRSAALSIMVPALFLTLGVAAVSLTAKPGKPPAITPLPPLALLPDLDLDGFPDALQPGPGIVQGVVMQLGTDAPLRNVLVSFTPVEDHPGAAPFPRYNVETRQDGTFEMAQLPPGQYRMSLAHDDFVRLHSTAEPLHVTVGDGRPAGDIRIHMVPGPAISGRILDENGNPAGQAQVELMRMELREGRRGLYPANTSVITDQHGEYRFFGLVPGEYYVRTRTRTGSPEPIWVYYPGVAEAEYAMPISVRTGADITGIDLSLATGKQYPIRLKVAIAPPAPLQPELSFYVNPRGRGGNAAVGPGMRFNLVGDSTWVSPLLAPGSYEIEVYLRDPDPVRWARATVEIKDAEVDAGTVVIGSGVWMLGRVTSIESLPVAVRRSQLQVVLRPLDGSVFLLPSARVREDGTFVIPRVPERRFRIELGGLPPEVYLASSRYGGVEVRESGISVSGDPDKQLELHIALSGGAIAGVVRNAKDQPMSGSQIILIPAARNTAASPVKTAVADQFGVFSIAGVSPGEYRILAWQGLEIPTNLDPAYLKSVENELTMVVVKRGFTNTVNVRALPPPN